VVVESYSASRTRKIGVVQGGNKNAQKTGGTIFVTEIGVKMVVAREKTDFFKLCGSQPSLQQT
jgi:hypothetical protein